MPTTEYALGTGAFTKGTKFHLVIFPGEHVNSEFNLTIHPIIKNSTEQIELHEILLTNKTKDLYKLFRINKEALYIIRPDAYIGYRSDSLDSNNIRHYFSEFLTM